MNGTIKAEESTRHRTDNLWMHRAHILGKELAQTPHPASDHLWHKPSTTGLGFSHPARSKPGITSFCSLPELIIELWMPKAP